MPCSCGSMTCPCGIPCFCSEESCKCDACAIALHRFCKICNKPLITDKQKDKETCSCFLRESTALILENKDNSQRRMGDIPTPAGYLVYGKLIVNVIIPVPVLHFPPFITQQPIPLIPPPSIQEDSGNILPSFVSDSYLSPEEASSTVSTDELQQLLGESRGHSNHHASTCISPPDEKNTEAFSQETNTSAVRQNTEEKRTDNTVQNTKSEMDELAILQEPFFYLPSIRIGNISFPVSMGDPVWTLPIAAFCIPGSGVSNLTFQNPFYIDGPIQSMTTFEEKSRQPATSLNFLSTDQKSNTPFDPTKITQSDLGFHGGCVKFEDLSNITEFNGFIANPSVRNYFDLYLSGQCKQSPLNCVPSNEISENLMQDEALDVVSPVFSSSLELQPEANDKRNDNINSLPLYIDSYTTRKMDKLLKSIKHSSNSSTITGGTFSL